MKHINGLIFFFVAVVSFITGCTTANTSTQTTFPGKSISIIIPIQPEKFSKQAVVRVVLLNEEQIAIEDANPICVIKGNGSGVTSTQCPPGTIYRNVTPEEFTFHIAELRNQIQVTSGHLNLGEQFQIMVAGLSVDDCNTRSTRYAGVADAEKITLTDLLWATTEMACMKTP